MTQPVVIELSAEAKALFKACYRELRSKAADELAQWNLPSLVERFDDASDYCWWWDEAEHALQHAPSFVLACGGDRKHLPAIRASLKVIRDLHKRWNELATRERDAARTVNEAEQVKLATGTPVLETSGVTTTEIPF